MWQKTKIEKAIEVELAEASLRLLKADADIAEANARIAKVEAVKAEKSIETDKEK